MRSHLSSAALLPLAAVFAVAQAPARPEPAPAEEARVVDARKVDDPALRELVARFEALAATPIDGGSLLAMKELLPLHEVPLFRRVVRERAPTGEVTLASNDEPGTRLLVRGSVVDRDGRPVVGALLYAYHTSAKGWYGDRAPHFSNPDGKGGDVGHARLFAYVRTDERGAFLLRTIRPGGYPRSTLPEHIHWHLSIGERDVAVGEILFDDDARLTPEQRAKAGRYDVIAKPEKTDTGIEIEPTLTVDASVTPRK